MQLAGSDDDIDAKKADITLTMAKPIPSRLMPQVGTLMTFQGTVSSYTPNPFMMTMTEGVLLDKNGNPISTGAPVTSHHSTSRSSFLTSEDARGSGESCSLFLYEAHLHVNR